MSSDTGVEWSFLENHYGMIQGSKAMMLLSRVNGY